MKRRHSTLYLAFHNLCSVGDGTSGERGRYEIRRCIGVDAHCVLDEIAAAKVLLYVIPSGRLALFQSN